MIAALLILNNDTLVCEDCYDEIQMPLDDGDLWPMGHAPDGECSICGGER